MSRVIDHVDIRRSTKATPAEVRDRGVVCSECATDVRVVLLGGGDRDLSDAADGDMLYCLGCWATLGVAR